MKTYKSLSFNITGMHCVACSNRLEKKLKESAGIYNSTVNFASNTSLVQYDSSVITQKEIMEIGENMGFSMQPTSTESLQNNSVKKELFLVIISWVFTAILTLPMLVGIHPPLMLGIIVAGLTILIPGYSIFKSAFSSILSGVMGMDVLIALGAFVAWASALLPFFNISIPNYSMTATMLIAVNLTGRLIETLARGSASKAVNVLANFNGKYAHKILENGSTEKVLISSLSVGDVIQIKSGEKIPTDCIITKGRTSVDESFLTGESLPIEKQESDYIYGGAVNIDGLITATVERDSTNNILAQTISLIQEAQGSKIPIQILVDKITNVFVPIILTISFLSFAIWIAFPNTFPLLLQEFGINIDQPSRLSAAISAGISVLVIACPCALGLATPMALVNGSTLSASKGILIRKGEAVQNLEDIDIIALDKTGTLTIGKPHVTNFVSDTIEEKQALEILFSLEQGATHPLALAVTQYAKTQNISSKDIDNISIIAGQGITGEIDKVEWFAGSYKATKQRGFNIPPKLLGVIDKQLEHGDSLVCLSNTETGNCEAIASFADTIAPETIESIHQLKQLGKKIVMITGDHKNAAYSVANQLKIKSVIYDCTPKKKLETIRALQEQNHKVCFVGDGINDAAALEIADVGMAIGTGTDVAIESGDVILVTGSLTSLVLSFKIAAAIFLKIKQNLFWAFFYNFIAIPLAFIGILSPIIAETAMSLSSLIVIGNSVLLAHKKI